MSVEIKERRNTMIKQRIIPMPMGIDSGVTFAILYIRLIQNGCIIYIPKGGADRFLDKINNLYY